MINMDEAIVGKKGEIIPKKKIRNIVGISPGDRVLVCASSNQLSPLAGVSRRAWVRFPLIATGTPSEIESELEEEGNN